MNDSEFHQEYGLTYNEAYERLKQIKARNNQSMQNLLDDYFAKAKKQTLRSKIEWFINLDRRKKELARLRNVNKV